MGSPEVLCERGPIVLAQLVPDEFTRWSMATRGIAHRREAVRLIVDTGAKMSMVDVTIANALGLVASRLTRMAGISPDPVICPVFSGELELGFERSPRESCVMRVPLMFAGLESMHMHRGYVGLLGRDILEHFQMIYDGPSGHFELRTEKDWERRTGA